MFLKNFQVSAELRQEIRRIFESRWKLNQEKASVSIRVSGGSWSGGGGTGMVCFRSEVVAKEQFDFSGRLKQEAYSNIYKVFMLDNFYNSDLSYLDINLSERPIQNLKIFLERYLILNPEFIKKLLWVIDLLESGLVVMSSEGLPRTWDTGEVESDSKAFLSHNPHCELIQIAIRYSFTDQNNKLIGTFIDVDRKLLHLIRSGKKNGVETYEGIYNEMLIWLHEAVYLISDQSSAKNSRVLTDFLLNQKTLDLIEKVPDADAKTYFNDQLKKLGFLASPSK